MQIMSTGASTPSPDGSLSRLLLLAASIHEKNDESNQTNVVSPVTLRQLVPIHNVLFQSTQPAQSHESEVSLSSASKQDEMSASDLRDLIAQVVSRLPVDTASCSEVLFAASNESKDELMQYKQKLLAVQYLLYVMNDCAFHGLATVVLPLLLLYPIHQDEVREAFLDAIFESNHSEDPEQDRAWLDVCLNMCRITIHDEINDEDGINNKKLRWATACRVLVRIWHQVTSRSPVDSQGNEARNIVMDCIHDKILQGIHLAQMEEYTSLRPITTWLLPTLYCADESKTDMIAQPRHVDELWDTLLGLFNRKDEMSCLVVATSVLCTVLPSLIAVPLPTASQERKVPLLHLAIWDLIYSCLSRGRDETKALKSRQKEHKASVATDQMLRRRGAYILRSIVENAVEQDTRIWIKYVMCFEALEMETEAHLVDQVWDAVADLCQAAVANDSASSTVPEMSWDWISVLFYRVLLNDSSPTVSKLGLFRLLNGHAGISVTFSTPTSDKGKVTKFPGKKKRAPITKPSKKTKAFKGGKHQERNAVPMNVISTDFVLNTILPCYDSVCASTGTTVQYEDKGKVQIDDLERRLTLFLENYLRTLWAEPSEDRVIALLDGLLSKKVVIDLRTKTALLVCETIAKTMATLGPDSRLLRLNEEILSRTIESFRLLFGTGSVVLSYRRGLLKALATMLSFSCLDSNKDPKTIVGVLSLYPTTEEAQETETAVVYDSLRKWLANLGGSTVLAASCASAFCSGLLLPFHSNWEPRTGYTESERSTGGAVALMCMLSSDQTERTSTSSSELLWPSIHKAVSLAPGASSGSWMNAEKVTRGLILLDAGCKLGILSGMGNGELIVDSSNETMMSPPPNIESLLLLSVNFIMHHIGVLTSWDDMTGRKGMGTSGCTRSGETNRVTSAFALQIELLKTLCGAYPSSMAVAKGVEELFTSSMNSLLGGEQCSSSESVRHMSLAYAALSCGVDANLSQIKPAEASQKILHLAYSGRNDGLSKADVQTARSVFQYAKWGALSLLVKQPGVSATKEEGDFVHELLSVAQDEVHATPLQALLPLFDCTINGARNHLSGQDVVVTDFLRSLISALFAIMQDTSNSRTSMYMLNEICSLIFKPRFLLDEYEKFKIDSTSDLFPIRDAFQQLISMAGTQRSHISRCVVSWITVGWLGLQEDPSSRGVSAIPYRSDIAKLLLHKECKMEESSLHQDKHAHTEAFEIPPGTNEYSLVRGFLLVFLSKLPDVDDGLAPSVLSDLLHSIIHELLNDTCVARPKQGSSIMLGTPDYCDRMRAWQALCVMTRFVTADIAHETCQRLFESFSQNVHGQIRFFMETFAVQFARKHPAVFLDAFIVEVRRRDLSIQHVSSLMIVGGNLLVGRYSKDFLGEIDNSTCTRALHDVLAGTIPWLSSTQGFSRAIAQLLVHKLIPLVIDVDGVEEGNNDWFLHSIYTFLEENPEMKRLRKKQIKFFDNADVDSFCTPEGVLTVPVDEGDEANPVHGVEAIKTCLAEVYQEAHENDTPLWKQVEDMLEGNSDEATLSSTQNGEDTLVNFQRKIIPLDSLNLALEESRERALRTASGRRKQDLIVCASLIDKVPNLAGLARTAEIFAAKQLVIPDRGVIKMDNFKGISVGAGDWIDIIECKENNLLRWLREQKDLGYTVIGLEQTSSSVSISELEFPEKTLLLLGKEKEGIPVEFLQVVDTCVEIPQQGIIRSLNVHVSGAVAIWEYSKQMMISSGE